MTVGVAFALCVSVGADAARKKKREEVPVPPPESTEVSEQVPVPIIDSLFPSALPMDIGQLPRGLANASAQGCNGCHFEAHGSWESSVHATGHQSAAFREAVAEVGSPACLSCHLPLAVQHSRTVAYDGEDIHQPVFTDNPNWDPTLSTEGVTCAACHLRDGFVVGSNVAPAPHPTASAPELARSVACAPCHQLTWPGADAPIYNTFQEWNLSPYAELGIHCQDCHMGPGPGRERAGSNHGFVLDRKRAVSVLVSLSRPYITRGGEPVEVSLRVQNTGAGHGFPTGSPYTSVRLDAHLRGPENSKGERAIGPNPFQTTFGRVLSDAAPWDIVKDTTLRPGGEREFEFVLGLGHGAPPGDWALRVTLRRVIRGTPEPIFFEQTIALKVD